MRRNLQKALKDAEFEAMKNDQIAINHELMSQVCGGKSAGYICSISGECNSSGKSCGSSAKKALEAVWETIFG